MAAVTADQVKTLRDQTGAGMMDCKRALAESGGDAARAFKILREKGAASAARKASRTAAEGLVGVAVRGDKGVMVEVNCETDFVARNEKFQEFVCTVAALALERGTDLEQIRAARYPGGQETVAEKLNGLIATIGENMSLSRSISLSAPGGCVAHYVHNAVTPEMGKIGVLVELSSDDPAVAPNGLRAIGEEVAMQVAAARPVYVRREEVPAERVAEEKSILEKQVDPKKPPQVREKIIEGKLSSFYEQVCLLDQPYIREPKRKVKDLLADAKGKVQLGRFARFAIGEA
ncbi:MAG: translation elongation factor Ts [Candidatus Lindowbacteria bacterium RIFCSPLOWO2_12_FULL_62_27]|nr:MAG: translation elongation factor Ts [Candidatus Lindowbacteria bacterium RIFCSPLOWO2_12_FULL_62_27]